MAKKQKRGPTAARTTNTTMLAKNKFDKGWKRVDLSDNMLEGFDDGNAFELEELTDYTLEDDGFGGKVLIAGGNTSNATAAKKKTKAKSKENATEKAAGKNSIKGSTIKGDKQAARTATEFSNDDDDVIQKNPVPVVSTSPSTSADGESGKKKKRKRSKKANKEPDSTEQHNTAGEVGDNDQDCDLPPDDVADHSAIIAAAAEEALPVLPGWAKFKLHPTLNASLTRLAFAAPTTIQALTLIPAMIEQRDVVGAAPTGSGKTLAFGLPVLQYLLRSNEPRAKCRALILTPTRELAIQIVAHLQAMIPDKRRVGIVSLVGGMAIQKQQRQLSYRPEIVVATPGRLWEVMESGETPHFDTLQDDLRFLIVDEADRMLQQGSFPQLESIFERVNKGKVLFAPKEESSDDDENNEDDEGKTAGDDGIVMLDDVLKQHAESEATVPVVVAATPKKTFLRQTFLFSATMTLKNAGRYQTKKTKNPNALTMLESIMKRIGLRGKPAVVDLSAKETSSNDEATATTPSRGAEVTLPEGLELAQVECLDEHRNNVLYYFLTQYTGRTIVFLNAISGVRKLAGVLQLLKLPVFALHAEMQQKQRLKKLDQFRANEKGILIATDVAARGLDIPSVDYVVHYHIPRSAETFVHRSGRTARASNHGLSISFVAPIDAKYHAQICNVLHRPSGFSMFPVDHKFLPLIKERVKLAESIFATENSENKVKSEATWFQQMAEAADLPFDDDMLDVAPKKDTSKVTSQRAELHHLLMEPLRPIGSKRKFFRLHEDIKSNRISADGEYSVRDANLDLMQKSKKHSLKRFRKR
ncbi:hypothetical protein H310_03408 [Aphanomyces invadans]|uniref:ATP-dependent RNA helicase n=1 Tax=Aphanomyces invadans TaxID=157072 RepID=A0A024UHB7_9STRA|nr:hypothetical protein H310_03408 [Aphanomyces invadans]ETW05689.1 hypothetical protein H310_03408 [Aphanomyces invadans]|eukprot:XP_008865466.1 hypothetical protein H310_03408 [Aphanomyces invadans]